MGASKQSGVLRHGGAVRPRGWWRSPLRAAGVVAASATLCATLLAVTTSGAGAATKYPKIPKGPITFGVSTPLSGAEAADGAFTKIGLDTALSEFDAEHPHGIDGHQVKLEILNDASDVTTAINVANQLVANKVTAVVTLTTNEAALQDQIDIMRKAGMPVVANLTQLPPGTNAQLSKEFPTLFSPNPSTEAYLTNAGHWIDQKGFKKVAFLNDGITVDTQAQKSIIAAMGKAKSRIVSQVTISPTSVDDSAAIAKLKASGADLLVVPVTANYGPIWQAILAANWRPTLLVSPGAWYSGFSSMGPLEASAYAYYYNCASSPTETFSTTQQAIMDAQAKATSNLAVNYLTFVATDSVPLEMLDYAITKENSTSPKAIVAALNGIHRQNFLGFSYSFSPSEHFGLSGPFASAVCHMGPPYAGGAGKVPVKG